MLFTNRGRWWQIFNEWENETHNDIHWWTNLHAARAEHLSQPAAETAFDGKLGPTHSLEMAFQRPSMDHHMVVEWSTERSMAVDCCHWRKCQSDCPQTEVFEDRCRLIVEILTHTINRSHRQQWWTVEVETTLKVVQGHEATVGDRSFPVVAARIWNYLPAEVTSSTSLSTFKSKLKSHLFSASFP